MLVNLTPHDVNVVNGSESVKIKRSGTVARVELRHLRVGTVSGVPIVRTLYGEVTGLPPFDGENIFIVSHVVRDACPDRVDLAVPTTMLKDCHGHTVGCKALSI